MEISEAIKYVGVNDHEIDLFEGQFKVPDGMAYNSYVILDEKIAIMDSVDAHFGQEWISNIKLVLGNRKPDFIVVQHMEMDHSSNIKLFLETYPEAKVVSSKMAFVMMKAMFGTDFSDRQIVVGEGSKLELGNHVLNFVAAPNVHWPEVIMTYESFEKVLFAADGFGKFGANDVENAKNWLDEARRYYFGIVGKFGANVQSVLKKASSLEIKKICSLHGPVIDNDIEKYINYYNIWSSYSVEEEGVVIAYTSVYGNTKKAVEALAESLKSKGCKNVIIDDLARKDIHECIADAFRYGKIVFASTTYNGSVFPAMREYIEHLSARNFQNRTVAFIENGSWAPMATKTMTGMLENCKSLNVLAGNITIKISMTEENKKQIEALTDALLK